jgi:potassium-transporting ATPase potassium-binding subunit
VFCRKKIERKEIMMAVLALLISPLVILGFTAVAILAFGGSLVVKRVVPAGLGTLPTTGPLFVALLIGVILIVGALTYFPAYSLGPVVEQLLMQAGKVF